MSDEVATAAELKSAGKMALALLTAVHGDADWTVYERLLGEYDREALLDVLASTVALGASLLHGLDARDAGYADRWLTNTGAALEGMRT